MEEAMATSFMMFITVPGQSDNTDNKCVLVLRRNIVDYIHCQRYCRLHCQGSTVAASTPTFPGPWKLIHQTPSCAHSFVRLRKPSCQMIIILFIVLSFNRCFRDSPYESSSGCFKKDLKISTTTWSIIESLLPSSQDAHEIIFPVGSCYNQKVF